MIGKTISHYKIIEEIGRGGMGVVYKARDTQLDRDVALKFLPAQFSADEAERKRFIHEAKAAAALNHPNIITVYEIGEHEGQIFIAMEYVAGRTLKELISSGRTPSAVDRSPITSHLLPITQILDIAIQLASGLAAAHAKGIVHRDLKPANIMLTEQGVVKIVDFGLAKLKGMSRLTKSGTTLGTVAYMSPEQALGKEVDQRSDIWSLGVILYEMLTGKLPFPGEYEQAMLYAVINEEPDLADGLRPDISAELKAIISKCLKKKSDARFTSAVELLADLKRIKDDTKPESNASGQLKKTYKILGHRKRFIAGSFILILFLALAGYFLFKGKEISVTNARTSGRPCVTVLYFENNSGDKNMDKWRSALAELLITDLSQSKLIDVVSGDQVFSILKKLDLLDTAKYSTEDLRRVADLGGSDFVVHGSYITAGKNLLLNVALAEVKTGKIFSAIRVESRGEEEIFSKVDELTRKIKLDFDFTPPQLAADPDKALATITTDSPQAFAYYNEGQKQNLINNYRKCIEFMEKAVALDPDFAMAWRSMAVNYLNIGYLNEATRYLEKAMEHLDNVSERERLLITGQYYNLREKTWPQAVESFQKLVQFYPNDHLATWWLGSRFFVLEEWNKAEQMYKKHLFDRSESASSDSNRMLSELYLSIGQYNKALQVAFDYQARFPGNENIYSAIFRSHLNRGEYDAALAATDKAMALSPSDTNSFIGKGDILFCRGDLIQAETWYRRVLELEKGGAGQAALGRFCLRQGRFVMARKFFLECLSLAVQYRQKHREHLFLQRLAYLDQLSGNFIEAQKKLDQILANARVMDDWTLIRNSFYNKGTAYAEAGLLEEAIKMAAELQIYIDKGMNKKLQRLHDHLLGLIAMKQGEAATAINLINRAISLLPGGNRESFRDTLGDALFQAGRFNEARQAYEAVTLSPTGRLNFEYGPCLFKLGRTYQKLGDKDNAIRNYTQFIDYWSGCDPQFKPQLAEARSELKKLQEL